MSSLTTRMQAAQPQDAGGLPQPQRTIAIVAILSALALVVVDSAIANIALPSIGHALHVRPALSVLVVTAYQLALVMTLLPAAALGESLGYRKIYTLGVALFTAASVLCALSPSLPFLVAARFLQGLGGAAIMSLGIALMRLVVPRARLGTAIGWNALTVALASAAGPAIGAFILSVLSWPWLFAVNLPLGAMALAAGRALPHTPGSARKLDAISMALNAGIFGAFVTGMEFLPTRPALAAGLLAAAGVGLWALIRREMPQKAPLIPIDLLRSASFRVSVIASVCCFIGQTAGLVALPFYLEHGLHQSALMTGLIIMPWPLTVALTAPVSGRLADRLPGAWLCAAGGVLLAAGLAFAAAWPLNGKPFVLVPMIMLCGLGFGLFQVPNNRNMYLAAPPERSGAAGGMQGTARLSGQTLGAVLMTLLFTLVSAGAAPRLGMAIGALLSATAGLVSILRGPAREGRP
jgi:DHA2 family multidrug resistance protein-like MFS transporter